MADSREANQTATHKDPAAQSLAHKSDDQIKREARARLKRLDPATATDLFNDVVGKELTDTARGFVDFLREHAIVGLAVGFVLATQVQAVVKQLITSFIDPLFLLSGSKQTLSQRTITWHFNGHAAPFGWGAFVYALIDFIFVAIVIYAIIKIFKLDRLDKKKA